MLVRMLLASTAVLAIWFAGTPLPAAAARNLTMVTRGPVMATTMQKAFVGPFTAATDLPVTVQSWDPLTGPLADKLKAASKDWDLVQVDGTELLAGCANNLFEKLDWSQIGGKDHYLPQAVSDCGVGAAVSNLVLAWDRDKFPGNPTWADFWDVAKFPGKRGLRKTVQGSLEIALLADGVAPGDVYKTLASNEGVDRAFRKLDQLRPYIVWWRTQQEAGKIITSGDVLMASAPSSEIVQATLAMHRNFGIQWNDSLYGVLSWAIVKGSPNQRAALQFLYFAGTPAIQARLVGLFGEGGLAKGAN
ncbi:MAG: extracellular solute-binding protein, partial [Acetobacteraceae bacterium]